MDFGGYGDRQCRISSFIARGRLARRAHQEQVAVLKRENVKWFGAQRQKKMIAHLRGKLISKHPNQAIVEAGGVGYDVTISVPTFSELPALSVEVSFFIHTHVREDTLALFGFLRAGEKQLFEKLLSVSGIGPKLAITILSGMPVDAMIAAIKGNNVAALTRVPGIGKKTAERMVLELRDKLDAFGVPPDAVTAVSPVEEDVISALVNLGYQRPLAERALAKLGDVSGQSFDSLFRKAMAALAK